MTSIEAVMRACGLRHVDERTVTYTPRSVAYDTEIERFTFVERKGDLIETGFPDDDGTIVIVSYQTKGTHRHARCVRFRV